MEFISGNIFIRPTTMDTAGLACPGHVHNFDHTTIVFRGSVRVVVVDPEGNVMEKEFVAPSHFLVKAECTHEITSLEPDTEFWCVYAHRTPQGDVVQVATGFEEAYK